MRALTTMKAVSRHAPETFASVSARMLLSNTCSPSSSPSTRRCAACFSTASFVPGSSAAEQQVKLESKSSILPWGFLPDSFREIAVDAMRALWMKHEQQYLPNMEHMAREDRVELLTGLRRSEFVEGATAAYKKLAQDFNYLAARPITTHVDGDVGHSRAVHQDDDARAVVLLNNPNITDNFRRAAGLTHSARARLDEEEESENLFDGEGHMCSDALAQLFRGAVRQWRASTLVPNLHVAYVEAEVISTQFVSNLSSVQHRRPLLSLSDFVIPSATTGLVVQVLFRVRESFTALPRPAHSSTSASSISSTSTSRTAETMASHTPLQQHLHLRERAHLWSFGTPVNIPRLFKEIWLDQYNIRSNLNWKVMDINGVVLTNGFAYLPDFLNNK